MVDNRRAWEARKKGKVQRPHPPEIAKPQSLSGVASEHWDSVVPMLAEQGYADHLDAPALQSLCEWWAEYRKLQEQEPADSGEAYKRAIAMASAFKNWSTLAGKFGLTPKDREGITAKPFTHDAAAEFIA